MSLLSSINYILATILVSYSLSYSKVLNAYDYFQEQAELYLIVAKFVYEQAAPRINPIATMLIFIQAFSIASILYLVVSRTVSSFRRNKKIMVKCGHQMEEIELIHVKRKQTTSKALPQPSRPLTLDINNESKDSSPKIDEVLPLPSLYDSSAIISDPSPPLLDSKQTEVPFTYSERARRFYQDPTTPLHPLINIRKGPSLAQKSKLLYEKTLLMNNWESCDNKIPDVSKYPKPDISDILDALTEFDNKVAESLRLQKLLNIDVIGNPSLPYYEL